jgi:hypothetical protein
LQIPLEESDWSLPPFFLSLFDSKLLIHSNNNSENRKFVLLHSGASYFAKEIPASSPSTPTYSYLTLDGESYEISSPTATHRQILIDIALTHFPETREVHNNDPPTESLTIPPPTNSSCYHFSLSLSSLTSTLIAPPLTPAKLRSLLTSTEYPPGLLLTEQPHSTTLLLKRNDELKYNPLRRAILESCRDKQPFNLHFFQQQFHKETCKLLPYSDDCETDDSQQLISSTELFKLIDQLENPTTQPSILAKFIDRSCSDDLESVICSQFVDLSRIETYLAHDEFQVSQLV